jgi:serine/threonine protein phosphatase 1
MTEFQARTGVLRLPPNTAGRDIIVGDIHGTFAELAKALRAIEFDRQRDRLICVGDLVDRGPDSAAALDWLSEPWFFACLGNHDVQYAFPRGEFYGRDLTCQPADPWYFRLDETLRKRITEALSALPWAIEVETPKGLVGVVHAGVPLSYARWEEFARDLRAQNETVCIDAVWDRSTARFAMEVDGDPLDAIEAEGDHWLPDVEHVFHGHTPARHLGFKPYRLANRFFIDTGAPFAARPDVFPGAHTALYEIGNPWAPCHVHHPNPPEPDHGVAP